MSELVNLQLLEQQAGRLVEAARKAGAEHCDASMSIGQSMSVSVREGQVEMTDRSEGNGFSLRVFVGNKVASVSSNQIEDAEELAERAVKMARVSPEDPFEAIAAADELAVDLPELDLFDETVPNMDELQTRALACEAAGLEVPGVTKSNGAGASWGASGLVLATSNGFCSSFVRSRHGLSASMVGGEGLKMERDYDYSSAVFLTDLKSAEEIGRRAGELTVKKLNPRQIKSGSYPVIFDKRIASSILGAMGGAINGASIVRKTSFLREKMGEQIANASITLIDNPLRKRGLGSRPFDGEGCAMEEIAFVRNGVLQDWVLDGANARELGLKSNSRAARSGSGTTPSLTNCHFEPGDVSFDEMVKSMGRGLYVCETIGHGINMVTGDFSKGAGGYWIENGEIAYPVSEITIAGNLVDMFMAMTPADDLEFKGAGNSPSLLIEGMTIGGQ